MSLYRVGALVAQERPPAPSSGRKLCHTFGGERCNGLPAHLSTSVVPTPGLWRRVW